MEYKLTKAIERILDSKTVPEEFRGDVYLIIYRLKQLDALVASLQRSLSAQRAEYDRLSDSLSGNEAD